MRLLVATDAHIYRTKDGNYWCKAIYGYDFWKRYLEVFDIVRIVARVKESDNATGLVKVCGDGIEIAPIPFYQGPKQFLKKYLKIKKSLKHVYEGCDAALFRMPSQTASMAYKYLPKNIPFAGEIVYDPTYDLKEDKGIVMWVINTIICNNLKEFCKKANGVSYVTEKAIQKNFPPHINECSNRFEINYSTITLDDFAFNFPHKFNKDELTLVLTDVAMNSYRKGEVTLLKTIKYVIDKGYRVNAIIIGDGSKRKEFEKLAQNLGIENRIRFTGLLPNSLMVREELTKSDIFFFPTKGEGLPRGIIEAMALGMPVLSSPISGIPEIIDKSYLFNPDDYVSFGNKVIELINNPMQLEEIGQINYNNSLRFHNNNLQIKRNEFYKKLRELCKGR